MNSTIFKMASGTVASLLAASVHAVDFNVKVTNLTHGMYLGDVQIAAHPQNQGVPISGDASGTGIQTLAETGDVSDLVAEFEANSTSPDLATLTDTGDGKTGPGESIAADFTSAAANVRLTILSKISPTNDGFVALNSIIIPTEPGLYTFNMIAYDAGTEANDEVVYVGTDTVGVQGIAIAALGDMNTGTNGSGAAGPDNNTTIHVHRGVLGDDLDSSGISDLDITTHRWLNPVARVIITVN
jgi:hypothetical protein